MNTLGKTASAAALCWLAAFPAWSADALPAAPLVVLKLQVQLDAGVVRVSDLWTNAGPKADTVIGPAPPPGRSIAVETGQLAYIARLYDVDWRPTSGVERASIERMGRPLSRDEVAEPIRRSLVEAGAAQSVTVDLANFAPALVPPASFPLLSVEGLAYDAAGERFSASISASTEGTQTQHMRITGRIVQTVQALVATRRLQPDEIIGPGDVRVSPMPARRLPGPVLNDPALAIGQSPKRTLVAGQALSAADVGPPVMVAKGATVVMVVESPGLSMAAQGLALGAGGQNDVIQVMNPLSRAVVAARVTGPGRAVIAPAALPITPSANMPTRNPEVAN
jgi:flagellar basal body P-ring formation protein FlgA